MFEFPFVKSPRAKYPIATVPSAAFVTTDCPAALLPIATALLTPVLRVSACLPIATL